MFTWGEIERIQIMNLIPQGLDYINFTYIIFLLAIRKTSTHLTFPNIEINSEFTSCKWSNQIECFYCNARNYAIKYAI